MWRVDTIQPDGTIKREQRSQTFLGLSERAARAKFQPILDAVNAANHAKHYRQNGLGLLFANRRGRPFSANKLREKKLRPLLVSLRIPLAGFHAFRHGVATTLIDRGASITTVGAQLRKISRNVYRRPGTQFHNVAFMKNFPLPREETKLQFRAEFYNLFNHPNLYVNSNSVDVNTSTFNAATHSPSPCVTAFFGATPADNRQIVIALKLVF